ncbi:unnamed protein product [Parajaminaea phylloscopi]
MAQEILHTATEAVAAAAATSIGRDAGAGAQTPSLQQLSPLPRTPLFLHPAAVILIVAASSQALKAFGHENVVALVSPLHAAVFHSSTARTQKQLKRELFETRQQLNQTSSQDEFAKWAKLRRKVDKTLADLEAINKTLASSRSSLALVVRGALFLATTILPFAVTTYFRKTPIFWLPPSPASTSGFSGWGKSSGAAGEWLGPLGWALSLPSAPRGAVSATVWNMVCGRIIAMVVALLKDIYFLVLPATPQQPDSAQGGQQPLRLARPSPALQSIWYGIGLASCSFAFSQFHELEQLAGIDLSSQFGGHYQFLTNISLVLTFVTLLLGMTRAVSPSLPLTRELKTVATAITMPIEVIVSLLYWTVLAIDPTLLIPSREVPDPLNPGQFVTETVRLPLLTDLCMHAFPAILLSVDYLAFSAPLPLRRPNILSSWPIWTSIISTISYCLWAEVCKAHNGQYPYPLLSVLSTTHRVTLYIGCALTMAVVLVTTDAVHRSLDRALKRTWNPKLVAPVSNEKVGASSQSTAVRPTTTAARGKDEL